MARKVFISVLGSTCYELCKYEWNNFCSEETCYIQEATLDYLNKKEEWSPNDCAYILLTEVAKKRNWEDNGHSDRETGKKIERSGLRSKLYNKKYPFQIESIENLPIGNNEAEIWDFFNRAYELIQDGDELYFDLTHGFRYLPMLILVLGNYAKFLKGVQIKSITYGNFEGGNKETKTAPIVDLLPLSVLQDWSTAAAFYLESGNTDRLSNLTENRLRPILREESTRKEGEIIKPFIRGLVQISEERQTCRGIAISENKSVENLLLSVNTIKRTVIAPLNPIIEKIKAEISFFDIGKGPLNCIKVAEWCFKNKQYQQAITILREGIVTFFCERYNLNEIEEKERKVVEDVFYRVYKKDVFSQETEPLLHHISCDEDVISYSSLFSQIRECRNDYNHSGMRPNSRGAKKMKNDIESFIERTKVLFGKELYKKNCLIVPKQNLLINLSNHPYEQWDETQKQAALEYGSCQDMPFPEIDPTANQQVINQLVEKFYQDLLALQSTHQLTVHIMGEMTFCFALIQKLEAVCIPCIASTTVRDTIELEGGRKESVFQFVQFRKY